MLWNLYQINLSHWVRPVDSSDANFLYSGVTSDFKFDDISSLDGNFPVESELPDVIFYYRCVYLQSSVFSLF